MTAGQGGTLAPENLTVTAFAPHLNQVFRADNGPGGAVELELIEAKALPVRPGAPREPFSLIFRGPSGVPLEQTIYRLSHDELGELDLFLVPLGSEGDPEGLHYQSLFN
jgi:hypothetical protein